MDHEEGLLAGLMRELSKKELSDLILTNQESMYRMAVSMLGSDADAQDAVSESITRAFENRCRLRDKRKAKSWLLGILANVSRELRSRRGRVILMEEPEQYIKNVTTDHDDLWEIVMGLPYEIRIVVAAYYYERLTIREISRMTGMAEGTVKSRLSKGRKILAEFILDER